MTSSTRNRKPVVARCRDELSTFAVDKRMAGLDSGDAAPLVWTFQMELASWPVAMSLIGLRITTAMPLY